jgi:hypothetical protein
MVGQAFVHDIATGADVASIVSAVICMVSGHFPYRCVR